MNQPAPKSGEPAGSAAFQRAREGYWGEVYRFLYPEPMGQVEQVGEAEALHQDFAARARRTLAVPDDSRINGLASAFPSDAGETPAIHAQPQGTASVAAIGPVEGPVERMGMCALAAEWPSGSAMALRHLMEEAEAIERVWSRASAMHRADDGSGEVARMLGRRDEALRFISARFYVECRAAGLPHDVIDAAAVVFARRLESSLCADGERILTVQSGSRLNQRTQELPDSSGHVAAVQPLTFGIEQDGEPRRLVRVEAFQPAPRTRGGIQ